MDERRQGWQSVKCDMSCSPVFSSSGEKQAVGISLRNNLGSTKEAVMERQRVVLTVSHRFGRVEKIQA